MKNIGSAPPGRRNPFFDNAGAVLTGIALFRSDFFFDTLYTPKYIGMTKWVKSEHSAKNLKSSSICTGFYLTKWHKRSII
ncbi:MAG: hypothetical protein IJB59_00945 [Oscillospiraceae bacterium]|nr:hypothetical protein [Oscillospiraceae bacterium]